MPTARCSTGPALGPALGLTGRILGFWLGQSWACAELGTGHCLVLPWDPAEAGAEQEAPRRRLWDVQLLCLALCPHPSWEEGQGFCLEGQAFHLEWGVHTSRWWEGLQSQHVPGRQG